MAPWRGPAAVRTLEPMTTKKGYLVALAVLVLGLGIAALFGWRTYQRIEGMRRVDMPGTQTVELPAGDLVAHAEAPAGTASTDDFQVSARCQAVTATGESLALGTPRTHTSYQLGSRQGASLFSLTVPAAGPITVTCDSGDRFVLAFGRGVGGGIVGIVVSGFAGVITALVIVIRTWRRRRRERKAAASPAPAAPAA